MPRIEAQLKQALYYLDNTTLTASEDGYIINLQVRPGMVSGIYRIGGIAALIVDADRYVLATYFQENLKYVKPGQPVEVSLDLYPGQIFAGKVDSIWRGNGWDSTFQAMRSQNSNNQTRMSRRASMRLKFFSMTLINRVFNRSAGNDRHLYRRRTRRLGRAAKDFHSLPFLVQLAISAQLLTNNQSSVYAVSHSPERAFRIGGQLPGVLPLSDWFSERAVGKHSRHGSDCSANAGVPRKS